ncbi:hypothetical protein C2S52_008718 [Perilla frutescens var. hirtella]|nr:hypothetical protein C2S52_008718 [Perilla frutescens var. hirtella]
MLTTCSTKCRNGAALMSGHLKLDNAEASLLLFNEMEHSEIDKVCCKSELDWNPVVKTLIKWNAMIAGYAQFEDNKGEKALHLLSLLQERGEMPDNYTFSSALNACPRGKTGSHISDQTWILHFWPQNMEILQRPYITNAFLHNQGPLSRVWIGRGS